MPKESIYGALNRRYTALATLRDLADAGVLLADKGENVVGVLRTMAGIAREALKTVKTVREEIKEEVGKVVSQELPLNPSSITKEEKKTESGTIIEIPEFCPQDVIDEMVKKGKTELQCKLEWGKLKKQAKLEVLKVIRGLV